MSSAATTLADGTVIKNKQTGELAEVVHPTNQHTTHFVYENGIDGDCMTSDIGHLFEAADAATAAQFVSSFCN